eukprot:COSAG02_NODE_846_length_16565_cov_20.404627_17_plen_49_part_01
MRLRTAAAIEESSVSCERGCAGDGAAPYARCHYHAPGHTMGACQAYYGG